MGYTPRVEKAGTALLGVRRFPLGRPHVALPPAARVCFPVSGRVDPKLLTFPPNLVSY